MNLIILPSHAHPSMPTLKILYLAWNSFQARIYCLLKYFFITWQWFGYWHPRTFFRGPDVRIKRFGWWIGYDTNVKSGKIFPSIGIAVYRWSTSFAEMTHSNIGFILRKTALWIWNFKVCDLYRRISSMWSPTKCSALLAMTIIQVQQLTLESDCYIFAKAISVNHCFSLVELHTITFRTCIGLQ